MLLNRKEFEALCNILSSSGYGSTHEPVVSLFTSNVDDALNKLAEARNNLDSVPKSMKPKIERALKLLEEMVREHYSSLAERRGPIYEATRLYILSAVDHSIKWYTPLLDNKDATVRLIPLTIPYDSVGTKNLAMAIRPTPTELEVFLTSINPSGTTLDIVLEKNEYDILKVIEEIVRTIARKVTIIERDRVIFMNDEIITVTLDEAGRIAKKLDNFDALYVLRYPFYDALSKSLSMALNEKVKLDLSTETPSIHLVIPLDNILKRPGIEFSGTLHVYLESSGVYPEKIAELMLTPKALNGIEASGQVSLAEDVELPPSSDYATEISSAIQIVLRAVEKLLNATVNRVRELASVNAEISKIEFTKLRTRGLASIIVVRKEHQDWSETSSIKLDSNGNLVSIETTLKTRYKPIKRVVDINEWEKMVKDAVRGVLTIGLYALGDVVAVEASPSKNVTDVADAWLFLSNALAETFTAYRNMKKEIRDKHRIDTKTAIALFLAYYADPSVERLFKSKTTRSFSEVFLRVSSYLNRLGKPVPGAYRISENPDAALLRLLEVGALSVSNDGHIYVAGSRLNDILSWLGLGDVEHMVLNKMFSDPVVSVTVMLRYPKLVDNVVKMNPELSTRLSSVLAEHGDKMTREQRIILLNHLAPKAVLELLLSKPEWLVNDTDALAVALHIASKTRESSKLTSFVLSNCPRVVGEDVQAERVGSTTFIERNGFLVLFAGLEEPSMSARRVYEVYDWRTKRGIVVVARDVNEAVETASKELQKAISELRLIISELDRYESEHGVQIDIASKNTEGYVLPEITVRYSVAGRERIVSIPLQPRLLHVFTETLRSLNKRSQEREVEEKTTV